MTLTDPLVPSSAPRPAPAIRLSGVSRRFDTATALQGVDITLPAGGFSVLLGPSGCGKSTLLRLIAGLDDPTEGRVLIDETDVTGQPPVKRDLSMVFQSYALFPHLSVAQNILFGLSVRRSPRPEQAARLARVAGMMGLDTLLDRRPSELSGGQQQRVALARAVISERPICLMDEPLSNLDARLRAEMRVELRALQQRLGLTVVYVTHDQVEAMTMADKIVVMEGGRVQQEGSPAEIYERPATAFTARFIGQPPMNLIPAPDLIRAGAALPDGIGARHLVGLRPEELSAAPTGAAAMIEGVEYLGADRIVSARIDGSDSRFLMRLPARSGLPETRFALGWAPQALHLFDAASGMRCDPVSLAPPLTVVAP